ncbi:Chromosome partition protein Smc, partial [Klebsiella oxytoca]
VNNLNKKIACLLISTSLLLSGCANTGSTLLSGTKPDSRLTTTEQSQFFSASGAQGCGVGAVSGAALGALIGALAGDTKKALAGAAIGGATGCAAGMAANYYLDGLKKDYASTSDRLQAMDKDISKDTAAVEKSTLAMKQVISENQAILTQMSIQKDKADFDKASAKKQLAQIDANISRMKDTVKGMKDKESAYKVALQGQTTTTSAEKIKLSNLNKEYTSLSSKISDLEKETNELYEQRQAISLG